MIGRNLLILNTATVCEAMQEYIAKRTRGKVPIVSNISYTGDGDFKVTLIEETENEEPKASDEGW